MRSRSSLAIVLLVFAGAVQAQPTDDRPFIAVHGQAREEVVPDVFPIDLTLKETDMDAAAAQSKIESLAQSVLSICGRLEVDDGDIDISNLSIAPEYRYDDDTDRQVFLGNTYERKIKVRFHSLERLKAFVSGLPESDALQIETARFESSRSAELRRSLLEKAIANARAAAETMADGVDRKLGAVRNISNQALNFRYSESAGMLDQVTVTGNRAAPAPVVLREGKIELSQDVYIVYELD